MINGIPIIGAPQVEDYSISVLLKCGCGQRTLVTGKPGSINQCNGCQRLLRINGFRTEQDTSLTINLSVATPPPADAIT